MDELLAGLKAIAETTRIRILFVLSHGELNVSELTYVLGQSQPRVSRHLKLMAEAGLLSRNKEGNWVLFRLRSEGVGGALARSLVDMLPGKDAVLSGDLARLEEVRRQLALQRGPLGLQPAGVDVVVGHRIVSGQCAQQGQVGRQATQPAFTQRAL